jgi:lipoprotein-releasing system ATP-binding protein
MSDALTASTGRTAPPSILALDIHRTFRGAGDQEIRVLRGCNLRVEPGEAIAITGPSGSGKSTLLHILGGLDDPTLGSVEIAGRSLARLDDVEVAALRNRRVGFVFQFHHLLRDFSALENVMIPLLIAGVSERDAEDRAREILDQVGLSHRLGHRPGKLSGGEQQRAAVARALANEPPVLLADEPSGNLDVETSERLHDVLFDLADRHETALVIVTHNERLAGRTDRILQLKDGVLEPITMPEHVH